MVFQKFFVCMLQNTFGFIRTEIIREGGSGGDTQWHSCLRHRTTSRKVAGSIHDGVIVILIDLILPGDTMASEVTHPSAEMSTRNICRR